MSDKVSGWYELEIIRPNGKVMIARVFGSRFSPGAAFIDAKSAAGLEAAMQDIQGTFLTEAAR